MSKATEFQANRLKQFLNSYAPDSRTKSDDGACYVKFDSAIAIVLLDTDEYLLINKKDGHELNEDEIEIFLDSIDIRNNRQVSIVSKNGKNESLNFKQNASKPLDLSCLKDGFKLSPEKYLELANLGMQQAINVFEPLEGKEFTERLAELVAMYNYVVHTIVPKKNIKIADEKLKLLKNEAAHAGTKSDSKKQAKTPKADLDIGYSKEDKQMRKWLRDIGKNPDDPNVIKEFKEAMGS